MATLALPTFTEENHLVRERMYKRQMEMMQENIDKISKHLITWIEIANLDTKQIPNVLDLSKRLTETTGRSLCDAEDPYLSHDRWFEHLAHKRFPVTNYIRPLKDFDFTPLPDLFHEYFGHMPQMFQQFFADIEEHTAHLHQRATTEKQKKDIFNLSRWTIEYWVLLENGKEKAIGTWILSSPGDLQHFCDHWFTLHEATLDWLLSTPPSPHAQHTDLFVFESLEQWTSLLKEYESLYLL